MSIQATVMRICMTSDLDLAPCRYDLYVDETISMIGEHQQCFILHTPTYIISSANGELSQWICASLCQFSLHACTATDCIELQDGSNL